MSDKYLNNIDEYEEEVIDYVYEHTGIEITFSLFHDGRYWVSGKTRVTIKWRQSNRSFRMYLSEFPGQCGALVMHSIPHKYAVTDADYNHVEYIHPYYNAINIVEAIAEYLDYGTMMASHKKTSYITMTLKDNGYTQLWKAYNAHSGNYIVVLAKEL